ncbi:MAG TPA: hypothetical protein ENH31_00350 [Nitrospirae bacterium]|nr:hypothetical protein [Nitrospirota bacterium]HDK17143.1 hypothetical protein [Nitrospirota bacterium]HDK81002.1 hypothetical protein [Nitrospirota bacterium]
MKKIKKIVKIGQQPVEVQQRKIKDLKVEVFNLREKLQIISEQGLALEQLIRNKVLEVRKLEQGLMSRKEN